MKILLNKKTKISRSWNSDYPNLVKINFTKFKCSSNVSKPFNIKLVFVERKCRSSSAVQRYKIRRYSEISCKASAKHWSDLSAKPPNSLKKIKMWKLCVLINFALEIAYCDDLEMLITLLNVFLSRWKINSEKGMIRESDS